VPLLVCSIPAQYVSGRAAKYELRWASEAGAVAEWAFRDEWRMSTDAALYIQSRNKSEEIANIWSCTELVSQTGTFDLASWVNADKPDLVTTP